MSRQAVLLIAHGSPERIEDIPAFLRRPQTQLTAEGKAALAAACRRLPAELDLHCLRHSYITHLVEFDYPERFVSEQAGHRYASTTAIYTGVSDDYRSRLVRRSLEARPELWEGAL